MNLYSLLSEHDNKVIHNFITEHAIVADEYIGNKEFLSVWSQNKTKLYHLLGNKFIHKIPFEKTRSISDIEEDMYRMKHKSEFYTDFYDVLNTTIEDVNKLRSVIEICRDKTLAENKTKTDVVLDFIPNKKTVKIQAGTKPMKAISKTLDYLKDTGMPLPSAESYEQFRCDHSMVLNNKVTRGNIVFSIHPMDFMTMSDNNYDWSSCMSWVGHGCYHLGSEEMMNSNNVICCYLESTTTPLFCFKGMTPSDRCKEVNSVKDYPEYSWSNKKWRILFYVTKDIICSGKAYPYENVEMTKTMLLELQKLAKQNMGWTYPFGPQNYYDHFRYNIDDVELDSVLYGGAKAIVFDTKAMYHDMLNDHERTYLCVRRPVKKPKLISISGKVKCLCCGDEDMRDYSDYRDDYNGRVREPGVLICRPCLEEKFFCESCEADSGHEDVAYFANKPMIKVDGIGKVCQKCAKEYVRKCPCCGEPFRLTNWVTDNPVIRVDLDKEMAFYPKPSFYHLKKFYNGYAYNSTTELIGMTGYVALHMCPTCKTKFLNEHEEFMDWQKIDNPDIIDATIQEDRWYVSDWDTTYFGHHLSNKIYSIKDESIAKYLRENLESIDFEENKN